MSDRAGVGSTGGAAASPWRDVLPIVAVVTSFVVGLLAGWYCAILALYLPVYPWLGTLVAPVFGVAAWRFRHLRWLCALLIGGCLAAAGGWVLLVLAGKALATF